MGSLVTLAGAVFVAAYLWEAVIERRGDPDQSLLFWYLPILFLGLGGLASGIAMLRRGIRRMREDD